IAVGIAVRVAVRIAAAAVADGVAGDGVTGEVELQRPGPVRLDLTILDAAVQPGNR
ncbi:MAG: hypothetical protein GY708_24885, partial [Actinomycetia bacterium]|nr:hypothetical protein [Actinomycetes bacterium]